jgi:hypothetical protein
MLGRITITLTQEEKDALLRLAEREFREPREQAALILRQSLILEGLIHPEEVNKDSAPSPESGRLD